MRASDSTRRAVRTVLDVVPAVLATLLVLVGALDLPADKVAAIGTVVGAITVLCAKVRNALEDAGYIPALLKAPASDGADPLPNDAGFVRLGALFGALCIFIGAVLAIQGSLLAGLALMFLGAICAFVLDDDAPY